MKITEKDLEKLARYADTTLYTIDNVPPSERGSLSDDDVRMRTKFFAVIHYYFILLTLDALRNKKQAKRLARIFNRLDRLMNRYVGALKTLANVLALKHEIKVSMSPPMKQNEVRNLAERILHEGQFERIHKIHEKVREEDRVQKRGMENEMFR